MEKSFNDDKLTPILKIINLKTSNLLQELECASTINAGQSPLMKHNETKPLLLKEECEYLSQSASMESEAIHSSMVKKELEWDNLLVDPLMCEWDQPEPVVVVQPGEKIIKRNEECVFDFPSKMSVSSMDGAKELLPKQTDIKVKTETDETRIESEKNPEVVFVDCKIKEEEVNVKIEDSEQDQISDWPECYNRIKCDDYKHHNRQVVQNQIKPKPNLNIPLLRHENPKEVPTWQCDKCAVTKRYKSELRKHLLTHGNHKDEDFFKCEKCDFRTVHRESFKTHSFRHKNPEEGDLIRCEECEYRTCDKSNFRRHLVIHKHPAEIEFFRCDKCDFKTIHKKSLKPHSLRHEEPEKVDLFRCNECEYKTHDKSNYRRHLVRHKNFEEVAVFKCGECEYRTFRKYDLKDHFLRHRNPNELDFFRCDKCDFKTIHKKSLKVHFLRHKNLEK